MRLHRLQLLILEQRINYSSASISSNPPTKREQKSIFAEWCTTTTHGPLCHIEPQMDAMFLNKLRSSCHFAAKMKRRRRRKKTNRKEFPFCAAEAINFIKCNDDGLLPSSSAATAHKHRPKHRTERYHIQLSDAIVSGIHSRPKNAQTYLLDTHLIFSLHIFHNVNRKMAK